MRLTTITPKARLSVLTGGATSAPALSNLSTRSGAAVTRTCRFDAIFLVADFEPRVKRSPIRNFQPVPRTPITSDFVLALRYRERMVPRIAISYRRSDSRISPGEFFDRLRQHFGREFGIPGYR